MVRRLLREALWAPVLPARVDLWWLVHIAAGAAVAFCYLRAIGIARPWLGELRKAAKYLLAFALACTTALAWEIGEFAVDQSDLILGVVGAAAYLAFHALSRAAGRGAR